MPLPNLVILYVEDPAKSSAFYSDLLERTPTTLSPNYTVFELVPGFKLGLLSKAKVEPPAGQGGSCELCLEVKDEAALRALHRLWVSKGVPIVLEPQRMYFGSFNFMGLDLDGHRLRVGTPDKV